jgi:hypothetical protein
MEQRSVNRIERSAEDLDHEFHGWARMKNKMKKENRNAEARRTRRMRSGFQFQDIDAYHCERSVAISWRAEKWLKDQIASLRWQ